MSRGKPSRIHESLVSEFEGLGFNVPKHRRQPTLCQAVRYYLLGFGYGFEWKGKPRCHRGRKSCNCIAPQEPIEEHLEEAAREEASLTGVELQKAMRRNADFLDTLTCAWRCDRYETDLLESSGRPCWPQPDAWFLDEDRNRLICVEVDVTHRAPVEKYVDLWWMLDCHGVALYLLRVTRDGLILMVNMLDVISAHTHLEINDRRQEEGPELLPLEPAIVFPQSIKDNFSKLFSSYGIKLSWSEYPTPTYLHFNDHRGASL